MRWQNIVWDHQRMRFWLECDRGTMNVRDLEGQVHLLRILHRLA